jgi:hypothetical protein
MIHGTKSPWTGLIGSKLLLAAFVALVVVNLVACGSLPVTKYVFDAWAQGRR